MSGHKSLLLGRLVRASLKWSTKLARAAATKSANLIRRLGRSVGGRGSSRSEWLQKLLLYRNEPRKLNKCS